MAHQSWISGHGGHNTSLTTRTRTSERQQHKSPSMILSFSLFAASLLRSAAASSNPPDPNCLTGIKAENPYVYNRTVRAVCCPASCGQCGGSGCQDAGQGSADCCVGDVNNIMSKPSCEESGPPCVIYDTDCLVAGIRAESQWTQDEYGIQYLCCPKGCGQCGGPGCGNITGYTPSECCAYPIATYGESCNVTHSAPCFKNFTKDLIEHDLGLQLSVVYEEDFTSGFPPFNNTKYVPFADKAFQNFSSFNETEVNKRYIRDGSHLELLLLENDFNPFFPNETLLNSRTELLPQISFYGGVPFQETVFSITTFFNDPLFEATFFQITQPHSVPKTVPLFSLEVNRGTFGSFIQVRFRGAKANDPTSAPLHYPERIKHDIYRIYEQNMNREVRWDVHFRPSLDPTNGFFKVYRDGLEVWSSEDTLLAAPCIYTAGGFAGPPYSTTCQGTSTSVFNTQMGIYSFAGRDTPFSGPDMTTEIAHFGMFKVE